MTTAVSSKNYADVYPSFGRHSDNKARSSRGFVRHVAFDDNLNIVHEIPNKDSAVVRAENFKSDNTRYVGRRVSRCPNWEYPVFSGILTGAANLVGGTCQAVGGFFINDSHASEGVEKIKRGILGLLGGGPLLQRIDMELGRKTN